MSYASGGNYEITLHRDFAYCRVWARPDVSRDEGAAFAREQIAHSRALALEPLEHCGAFVFDLAHSPDSWGPLTHAALVETVSFWETAKRRVAVVGGEAAIQRILIREVIGEGAPTQGRLCMDRGAVEAWLDRSLHQSPMRPDVAAGESRRSRLAE